VCWRVATGDAWILDEWRRVRQRQREDQVPGPSTPEYLITMIRGASPIWVELEDDPLLLEDEVWRLFEPEEAVLIALNGTEMYEPEGGWWSLNIARMATLGQLDADRVRVGAEWAIANSARPSKNRAYKRILTFMDQGRRNLW